MDIALSKLQIDVTGNIKKHSSKSPDRGHIHSGTIAGMSIGHYYSFICLKDVGSWMLPVAIDRIPFGENKMEFSVSQITPIFKKIPKDSIGLCIGDSAYSCNKFVQPLYKTDNVVTITRARRNKAIYKKYIDKKEGSGRKRHYGEKSKLNNPDSLPTPDFAEEFEEVLKNGSIQTVKLRISQMISSYVTQHIYVLVFLKLSSQSDKQLFRFFFNIFTWKLFGSYISSPNKYAH